MAALTYPRIAIIGGGPAGLTLCLTLHRHGIAATIYECEMSHDSRAHLGGMLDLGYESGQRALRENGLEEAFVRNSRPEADATRLLDASGTVVFSKDPDPTANPVDLRPEIDRPVLRKMLADALPAGTIKWGYALASVRDLGQGVRELTFANGHTATVDILVGADGVHSRVRPLVTPATPIYHGINGAEVALSREALATPELQDVVALVGGGSMYAYDRGQGITGQLNGDGRIRSYVWFRAPADWVVPAEPAEARRVLLDKFVGWAPTFRKMIEHCDDDAIYPRPLYHLPTDLRWEHVPGVTVIGDAAHLMSPFAGAGVNLAMMDALELGQLLADAIKGGKTVEEREAAVAVWEGEMMSAASHFAVIASNSLSNCFSPDGAQSALKAFQGFVGNAAARRRG